MSVTEAGDRVRIRGGLYRGAIATVSSLPRFIGELLPVELDSGGIQWIDPIHLDEVPEIRSTLVHYPRDREREGA